MTRLKYDSHQLKITLAHLPEDYTARKLEKIARRKMSLYQNLEAAAQERLKNEQNLKKWEQQKQNGAALLKEVEFLEKDSIQAGYPIRIFINWDIIPLGGEVRMRTNGKEHLLRAHETLEQSEEEAGA